MSKEDSMMIDRFCEGHHWNYKKDKNRTMARKAFNDANKIFGISNMAILMRSIDGIIQHLSMGYGDVADGYLPL